jgi:acetyl-CoA carboxylase carboxyltransferase component
VHSRNGVCHFVAKTHLDAIDLVPRLLSYLPQNAWEAPPISAAEPPAHGDPGDWVPSEPRLTYDVRDVIRAFVDGSDLLEVAPRWARNVVTALCRLDGRSIGVIANQPKHLGGVLDADAAQKAARFVRTCNMFGLPIVALVDTPGFLPGSKQEACGVIRHGAKLVHAFAEATVPKLSIVLRKAYGGAYITMNAKDLGADFAFAWPGAEIGIMAARQAVRIVHRRELEDDEDQHQDLTDRYAEQHLSAQVALRDGFLDEMIEPGETRARLAKAFATLEGMIHDRGPHGKNIPL